MYVCGVCVCAVENWFTLTQQIEPNFFLLFIQSNCNITMKYKNREYCMTYIDVVELLYLDTHTHHRIDNSNKN